MASSPIFDLWNRKEETRIGQFGQVGEQLASIAGVDGEVKGGGQAARIARFAI